MTPELTLAILNALQKLGFNDEAFWRLHHFKHLRKETIAGFRAYAEKRISAAFLLDGQNERVGRRLALVLAKYDHRKSFIDLAEAAFDEIPPLQSHQTTGRAGAEALHKTTRTGGK